MKTMMLIAVLLPIAWIIWKLMTKKPKGSERFPIAIKGFPVVHYPASIPRALAEDIALSLLRVVEATWGPLNLVYGSDVEFYLAAVQLNDTMIERPVVLHPEPGIMELNPFGGKGKTAEQLFAFELHNLIRSFLGLPYRPRAEEMDKWNAGQAVCAKGGLDA